jgi:hypothetical protein
MCADLENGLIVESGRQIRRKGRSPSMVVLDEEQKPNRFSSNPAAMSRWE